MDKSIQNLVAGVLTMASVFAAHILTTEYHLFNNQKINKMKRSITRIIVFILAAVFFHFFPLIDIIHWFFKAAVTVYLLEYWVYAIMWKINASDNLPQPK